MAVNKNFVVKNGIEVATDLIFASSALDKVGIGSTIPTKLLEVGGDSKLTGNTTLVGFATVQDTFEVGTGGTVLTVDVQAGRIGLNTATAHYNVHISNVGSGSTTLLVDGGDLKVDGNIFGGDLVSAPRLNITGIATFGDGTGADKVDINADVDMDANLHLTGVATVTGLIDANGGLRIGTGGTVGPASGGIVTYYGDGSQLTNITATSGGTLGFSTAGAIGYGVTFLKFVGAGVSTLSSPHSGIATLTIVGGGGGGSANIGVGTTVGDAFSGILTSGNLWYNTNLARLFIYYFDGSSNQWVDAAPFNIGIITASLGSLSQGTALSPPLAFSGDTSTGLFSPATGKQTLVSSGSSILNINPGGVEVTGVVTATTGNITGNLTVGGVLTYEDVTNVDSIGVVTARTGIRIGTLGVGATIGPALGGIVTYYGDGQYLDNIQSGVGIQTAGAVGYGVTLLKFVGTGVSSFSTPTAGVSTIIIEGGGGGTGLSTVGINTGFIFSNPNSIDSNQDLSRADHNYAMFGPISLNATVTVGTGNTFTIV